MHEWHQHYLLFHKEEQLSAEITAEILQKQTPPFRCPMCPFLLKIYAPACRSPVYKLNFYRRKGTGSLIYGSLWSGVLLNLNAKTRMSVTSSSQSISGSRLYKFDSITYTCPASCGTGDGMHGLTYFRQVFYHWAKPPGPGFFLSNRAVQVRCMLL